MLGTKRKKQWAQKTNSKRRFMRTASDIVPFAPKQFGAGYNPKAVSYRKPPPNLERKWSDTTGVFTSWVSAGGGLPSHAAVDSLVRIAQGDAGHNRQGNKIMVTNINLRATVECIENANNTFTDTTPGDVYFRWMLIIDTQANGAFPSITDIFEESPSGGDQFDIFNSLLEAGRYKVLMDKFIRVPAAAPMYNGASGKTHVPNRLIHFKKSFKVNLPVHYSDGTANMASVRNNNIMMVIFNGHGTGANLGANYRARVRFTDY